MKKDKTKTFLWSKKTLGVLLWVSIISVVFAADYFSDSWDIGSASGNGSNNSTVSVIGASDAQYWNKGNNSTIIGNYFRGFYYDSQYGFFRLDHNKGTPSENVTVVSSTSACSSGYGYKLWGFAYSESFGFIDFDYNSSIFVYYCESDKKLHGYAYNQSIGFQNFEGIGFEIIPNVGTVTQTTSTGVFVNDTTSIPNIPVFTGATSNFDYNSIFGDTFNLDATQESIFYIVK